MIFLMKFLLRNIIFDILKIHIYIYKYIIFDKYILLIIMYTYTKNYWSR